MKHKKDPLPQSEKGWLQTDKFVIGTADILGNNIRYAVTTATNARHLVTMVGGIPRDPERRKQLPLINKLYGLIATKLVEQNIISVLYNQPATGGSGGDWKTETLASRSDTLSELIVHIGEKYGINEHVVVGTSAGAYMAAKAIERVHSLGHFIKSLALLSPAAYPFGLESVPYGKQFTEIIREPWDVADSPIFPRLQSFTSHGGLILLSFFEADNPPIPDFIQDYFREFGRSLSRQGGKVALMTIPGVAHNFRRIHVRKNESAIDNNSVRSTANTLVEFLSA